MSQHPPVQLYSNHLQFYHHITQVTSRWYLKVIGGNLVGVVASVLACDSVVGEFKLLLYYYVDLATNTLGNV